MSEQYISKGALTEAVYLSMHDNPHKDGKIRANHNNEHMHFVHMIYHMPGADVLPVVHAKWDEQFDETHFCSNCDYNAPYDYEGNEFTPSFCYHCGAIMDLK